MELQRDIFDRPRFRSGVDLVVNENNIALEYRRQGCALDYPDGGRDDLLALVRALETGGATVAELQRIAPKLADEVKSIVEEFDRLGLLTESAFGVPRDLVSGAQLQRELLRLTERLKERCATSAFYKGMADGAVTRNQLIGYVLEYYHIVSWAPGLIAPALANAETPKTRRLLQDFLSSELHHDRMIVASLGAVGIDARGFELLQPLPTTFAVCASLGVFAKQHPLSFKASLFLFEQSDERFNEAFATRSRQLGLPEGFIEPILRHAGINDDAEHDAISSKLLGEVPCVSAEEQVTVKKNVAILLESLLQQEAEILSYYGNVGNRSPRIFD